MYDIIKQRIANGGYKLSEMQHIIHRRHDMGGLTDEQEDELISMAVSGANIDSERPDLLEMVISIAERVTKLEQAAAAPPEVGETPVYREWQPWDGISNDYQPGAVVTHNGKVWENVLIGQQNVWEPGTPGIDERYWVCREERE